MNENQLKNFQKKVKINPVTGCHEWTGNKRNGYGQVGIAGKKLTAHRVLWEHLKGPIPEGVKICHKCDNPSCVNNEHHFLGTQTENIYDMIKKDRHYYKLTDDDVLEIRSAPKYRGSGRELANKYGVTPSLICIIRKNKCRKNIQE